MWSKTHPSPPSRGEVVLASSSEAPEWEEVQWGEVLGTHISALVLHLRMKWAGNGAGSRVVGENRAGEPQAWMRGVCFSSVWGKEGVQLPVMIGSEMTTHPPLSEESTPQLSEQPGM